MPNLRSKTWTTTTPANVEDAQYWEDHLISDAQNAKISSSVQSVNSITPDASGNVDIVALPSGGTAGQVLTKLSSTAGDADWEDPASSGHTIQNPNGTDMPYQEVLQFRNATVSNDSTNGKTVVDCHGEKGDPGDAATIAVGTTSTLPEGSSATVTNSGTSSAAVFDFGIPKGDSGADGADGVSPEVSISSITGGHTVTITDADHPSGQSFNVMDGADGSDGSAATIAVGTVTSGSTASVTNSGTSSAAVFDFVLPKGDQGDEGDAATISVGTVTTLPAGSNATVTNAGTTSAAVFNFGIPRGADGTGSGDMTKVDYDSDLSVLNAGGIKPYVATAISGKADSSSLATVATTGDYADLTNKPTIPAAQVNSDWDAVSGVAQILNKPSLATVATSGSYTDLSNTPTIPAAQVNADWNAVSGVAEILNKPTIPAAQVNSDWNASSGVAEILNKPSIPTVNDATLTIQQNGTQKATFTSNASSNATANIVTDEWTSTATVSSGSVSFSGLDDTQGWAYRPVFNVTTSSTNKNPTAQISTLSGTGTSSMSVTYTTDADNGTSVKLRIIK